MKVLPSASALLLEKLKAQRNRKTTKNVTHNGNVKFDDIIEIAKKMRDAKKSCAKELEGTCKEILGTAVSLGCTVDGKSPKDVTAAIDSGEVKCS